MTAGKRGARIPPWMLALLTRVFRLVTRLAPADARRDWGADALDTFIATCERAFADRGWFALVRVAFVEWLDLGSRHSSCARGSEAGRAPGTGTHHSPRPRHQVLARSAPRHSCGPNRRHDHADGGADARRWHRHECRGVQRPRLDPLAAGAVPRFRAHRGDRELQRGAEDHVHAGFVASSSSSGGSRPMSCQRSRHSNARPSCSPEIAALR